MPQVSNELQKKVLMHVLPPLFKALELPVVPYNPVGVFDKENKLIIPTQVSSVEWGCGQEPARYIAFLERIEFSVG